MPKFNKGDWVRKNSRTGSVVGVSGKKILVRWLGTHKAEAVGPSALRSARAPWAVVLEGSLDENLASTRSGEEVLRRWLQCEATQLVYKNVHTLEDIRILGRVIGKSRPLFVLISCHGVYDDKNLPYIYFAPRDLKRHRIYLHDPETVSAFRGAFKGQALFFSACDLGRHQAPMSKFRKAVGLSRLATYTREVYDSEALLFELMVYHGMLNRHWTFATSVRKAANAMTDIGVRGSAGHKQTIVRLF